MDELENPLLSKTQVARLFGISLTHLNYYIKQYKHVAKPAHEIVADRELYRRNAIIAWWDSIKHYQSKEQ